MWNLSIENGRFKLVRLVAEVSKLRNRHPRRGRDPIEGLLGIISRPVLSVPLTRERVRTITARPTGRKIQGCRGGSATVDYFTGAPFDRFFQQHLLASRTQRRREHTDRHRSNSCRQSPKLRRSFLVVSTDQETGSLPRLEPGVFVASSGKGY
jgi:hypothetical protein